MTRKEVVDFSGAVIVCSHVAVGGHPILRGRRDQPLDAEDSGWQFTCGATRHDDEDEAQVWALNHVIREEPSLREFVTVKPGTVLERTRSGGAWKVIST